MGQCTTVTGRGRGAADGKNKGSEHQSLGVAKLIGPRVVAAGKVTLVDGAATIKLPYIGDVANYIVTVTDVTAANACSASMATNTESDGSKETVITFAGNTTNVLNYTVVKAGVAV
jgi:hypothetical protein